MDGGFLRTVVTPLRSIGADVVVFGGWAEELRGLRDPGSHSDVDLLYFAPGFDAIDGHVVSAPDLIEIREKRFHHKRAFVQQSVRVELFLVSRDALGPFTPFWGREKYRWPLDVNGSVIDGLPVASAAALTAYRRDHEALVGARDIPR
jgi:hypothetical protein